MAQLKADLINGNDATLTVEGWTFNRSAIVYGLTGFAGYAKLVAATQYLQTQGAYIGQPHPAWPTAFCRQISPVAISNDTIEFTLVYKENSPVDITMNTSLSQECTNIDATGLPIRVRYTYPVDYIDPITNKLSTLAGTTTGWQGGTVMKYMPEISFTYTRSENLLSHNTDAMKLIERKKRYEGKINDHNWVLGGVTQEQWKWMCSGITAQSNDGGVNYIVSYSFNYRKGNYDPLFKSYSGWRAFVVYTLPDGKPADFNNPVQYESYMSVPVYDVVDFRPLGIV